jgi:hypothetical protein
MAPNSTKCPLSECDIPWSEHDNIKKLVHKERAEDQAPLGRNGGIPCSTRSGPCACGAWH